MSSRVSVRSGFITDQGRPCRIVEQFVMIDGQRIRATGTVCQQPGGMWVIVP